ncbi:hypothetical protein VNO80_00564 [Phaseolus coccineus]|uniref:Uncharacterized protein n=1 Tax=Phaseolus coccineus TaxID=3886 RepID=A0AAN9NZ41_PHACN
MANPILIRPWSRLGSLRSPSSASAAESHPKPQLPQPSLKTTNTNSHDTNAIATKSLPTTPDVHTPIHSPDLKSTTPMIFPAAKLKVHPHPVVEVTIEKPSGKGNASLKHESEETKNQVIGPNETKGKGIHTKVSEGHGVRVITISGENRGAYMKITQSQKKQPIHKMGNSDGEKVRTLSSPPTTRAFYGNSNVQCVNNSMLLNSSLSHHEPGVHLIVPKKPFGKGLHLKERDEVQYN